MKKLTLYFMDRVQPISMLPEIQSDEVKQLQSHGITTVDDLWNSIGQDFDWGIQQLAENTGINQKRLRDLLATQGEIESARSGSFWLHKHWLDVVLGLVALIVLEMLLRATGLVTSLHHLVGLSHDSVISKSALPAFHVISKQDVKTISPAEPGTFSQTDNVVGHYTLQPIQAESILRTEQLSTVKLSVEDLNNRQLLSLPINLNAITTATVPGSRVEVIVPPRALLSTTTSLRSYTLEDVIVLGVERRSNGATLTLAIKKDAMFEAAKPLLGMSDILILHPMR